MMMSNRSKHVGKKPYEKPNYNIRLKNSFSESTIKDSSTESSNTSTIEEKNLGIQIIKKRPKSKKNIIFNFVKDKAVILAIITILVSFFLWLIQNDYAFEKDISILDNNLSNLKENTTDDIEKLQDKVEKNSEKIETVIGDNIYLKTNLDNLKEK